MTEGVQLIVGAVGLCIEKIAVQLRRLDAEHQARIGVVAEQALIGAGIQITLHTRGVIGERYRERLVGRHVDAHRVGLTNIPLVGRAAQGAIGIAHQQTRFESTRSADLLIDHHVEIFDDHGAVRECPATGLVETDFRRRS